MVSPDDTMMVSDRELERQALAAAIAVAEADPRRIPHSEMRIWLGRLAAGELDAPPPTPR